eukprot:5223559-Amphidinium_carterae.1
MLPATLVGHFCRCESFGTNLMFKPGCHTRPKTWGMKDVLSKADTFRNASGLPAESWSMSCIFLLLSSSQHNPVPYAVPTSWNRWLPDMLL